MASTLLTTTLVQPFSAPLLSRANSPALWNTDPAKVFAAASLVPAVLVVAVLAMVRSLPQAPLIAFVTVKVRSNDPHVWLAPRTSAQPSVRSLVPVSETPLAPSVNWLPGLLVMTTMPAGLSTRMPPQLALAPRIPLRQWAAEGAPVG